MAKRVERLVEQLNSSGESVYTIVWSEYFGVFSMACTSVTTVYVTLFLFEPSESSYLLAHVPIDVQPLFWFSYIGEYVCVTQF